MIFEPGCVIDMYNRKNLKGGVNGICGVITVGTAHRGSGTFLVVEVDKHRGT